MAGKKLSSSGQYESVTDFFIHNYNTQTNAVEAITREFDKEFPEYSGKFRSRLNAYLNNYHNAGYENEARKLEKLLLTVDRANEIEYELDDEGENKKCSNRDCGTERDFEKSILANLDTAEYDILDRNKFNIREGITYIPDIVCRRKKDGIVTVIEVKKCTHNHRLFTAIGQLIYHRGLHKHSEKQREYIVALPINIFNAIDESFVQYVKDDFDIQIKAFAQVVT